MESVRAVTRTLVNTSSLSRGWQLWVVLSTFIERNHIVRDLSPFLSFLPTRPCQSDFAAYC